MPTTDLLADYTSYLRLKALSEASIKKYRYILRVLFRFLDLEPSQAATLSAAQIRRYASSLQERGLAANTVTQHVKAIRGFCSFLVGEGYLETDPSARIPIPKVGRRLPRAVSKEEIRRLFRAMEGGTKIDRRNRVLFHLLYMCGLRIGEGVRLKVGDVDLEAGILRVIGKGDKERRLYLKPMMVRLLEEYIAEHCLTGFLFPGRQGHHVAASTMQYQFQRYVQKAGFQKKVTPHTLRHSAAVHYLMGGAPLSFVQDLLGHESLATTGVYTQLADPMMRDVTLSVPTAIEAMEEDRVLKEREAVFEVARQVQELGVWRVARGQTGIE